MDLAALVDALAARADDNDRDARFPTEGLAAVHEAGLLTVTVGTRYGGPGAGLARTVDVVGELGRGDPAVALIAAMTIITHATQARSAVWPDRWYKELLAEPGLALVNTLRVEPALGTPARGGLPATVARRTAHGWSLTGHKIYATGSTGLRWLEVWARTDEPEPRVGLFLVRADTPGIRIVETWDHLGLRASAGHDVLLTDVVVPADATGPLGPPVAGPPPGSEPAWNNLVLPSLYLGVARAARDWLVTFLRERVPANLGAPLATLPRFQAEVGEIEVALGGAQELLRSLAERVDAGGPDAAAASAASGPAKLLATRAAIAAVERAVAAVGNPGLTRANPLQRHLRDVLCARVHTPQDDVVTLAAGRAALTR